MIRPKDELHEILSGLQKNHYVLKMKEYKQHGRITTYDHCEHVARLSYKLNRALHLNANVKTLVTGAMLHDFFLYDWHADDNGTHKLHGFTHAEAACKNAEKFFHIDKETRHVIYCHMWPLNIGHLPRSKEAWIVCMADKWESLKETLFKR